MPSKADVTNAFWHACRGGQRETAEYLLRHGADLNWIGYDHKTPLQAAQESGVEELVGWLQANGAKTAQDLLDSLVEQISNENRHDEVDPGRRLGDETW